ncbi:uncharacterized protein cubi_01784 [Cryptosporidium ubiquitum]|uniref:Uncharacterized protein n=1 Tax=Cryptosporidium ubiquitum TaxID=857276 RepID=A0A1J4MEL6_9CRYT|nr:uncharacterized protein cubi_01784 [Cryptosporidium ubiquitum]OII71309.1 hypothetical protein cubi_01784 [Cryptosporidium ubiquitum]
MISELKTRRSKVISLFIQCMLLVKNLRGGFENIFELVNACNDELCTLLLEVVFTKRENGNDFIGIRSNINSNIDMESEKKERFGFLNLGLKRIKNSYEIKGMKLYLT